MRKKVIILFAFALALVLLALPVIGLAGPPGSAIMQFGRPDLGRGCSPAPPDFCDHDQSFKSVDTIQPGAVAISSGGTVNFDVEGFHQVAIYEPGIKPADIDPDEGAFPFVNDPNGRIFLSAAPSLDAEFLFAEPGKYLVIREIAPHLVFCPRPSNDHIPNQ